MNVMTAKMITRIIARSGSTPMCVIRLFGLGFTEYEVPVQGDKYPDGVRTHGGYSTGIIANQKYIFPIPDGVSSEDACSMLCGGLTVYSPLVRNGAGPGKKVGVIGIGGLVSVTQAVVMFFSSLQLKLCYRDIMLCFSQKHLVQKYMHFRIVVRKRKTAERWE